MTKPSVACEVEITGILARDACVTVLPNDHGTALPAIRFEMQSLLGNLMIIDWPRPDRTSAQREADRFKCGMRVSVISPVRAHALHIHDASKVELTVNDTTQRTLL